MAISFQSYTQAAGRDVATLSPSLPANNSSQVLLAVHNVLREDGSDLPPVCTAPAGWTLVQDNGVFGQGKYRAVWRKVGDGSTGTITWSYSDGGSPLPIRGEVVILCYAETDTTTPVDVYSFKNEATLTSTHTTNSIATTLANSMVVGVWASGDTGISFLDSTDLPNTRVSLTAPGGSATRPLLIADAIQAVAGASGVKTANTNSDSLAQIIVLALRPAPNPSRPQLTYPNGGEQLTAGATVAITWTQSTSPTATQASLKYNLDYSANNGSTWTAIVALTSAGVGSYNWTVPSTTGNGYLIRIRAYDPARAIYSLNYDQSDAAFSVVTEVAPPAPTGLSPNTISPAKNKAISVTLAWTHGGGAANPQTEFTLQWSNNGGSSWTTVGPTATATQSTSIDFSGQTAGATITWRVKTKGVSLYSDYPNNAAFVVASLPATPNITAPTNASPPTVPNPTLTFTSSDAFTARKYRLTQAGVEVHNTGWVTTTNTSDTIAYALSNGITYTLYLAVRNQYGLESVEDSETFTVSYSGPVQPTLTVTGVADGGYILAKIANSDTPSYNELWRYEDGNASSTAIRVGASIPKNGSFPDSNVQSGKSYRYFARAYNSGGLYTDSAASAAISISLGLIWLHAVTKTSGASNVQGAAIGLNNIAPLGFAYGEDAEVHGLLGRTKPLPVYGQAYWQNLSVTAYPVSAAQLASLKSIYALNTIVCARDQFGNRLFGKMTKPQAVPVILDYRVTFSVTESNYSEPV